MEKVLLHFCPLEDENWDYCLCSTKLEIAQETEYCCYSDHALLFWFCYSGSLVEIVCTVQHSATLLIFEDSQCGWRVDHFLLAWKGDDFSVRCMSR